MIQRASRIGVGRGRMKALILNAGSSTYKLSLFEIHSPEQLVCLWKGKLDWGTGVCRITAEVPDKEKYNSSIPTSDISSALKQLIQTLWNGSTKVIEGPESIEAIGHRIVHGGAVFETAVRIDHNVKEEIRQLIPLAPLHNPINLAGIELMEQLFPSIPQIAVFDTAFHATMSEVIKTYPISYEWKEKGIQRYGFHGISHHYCAERVQKIFMKEGSSFKMINCHLGSGASLCAIENGKSMDTTMGMTPMEGLMMGTRSGTIDPGVMLYLLREEHLSIQNLDELLNFESGLKGIAGSSDMREVMAKRNENRLAQLAIDLFVYRLKYFIGALAASLNGLDLLCFTGGIGEHDAVIREAVCEGLTYLGISLDKEKNKRCEGDQEISLRDSKLKVVVVETQEEWMIARACFSELYEKN